MPLKPYYDQDGITIYHGDCREVDASAEVLFCDPPYGIKYQSAQRVKWQRFEPIQGDSGLGAYDLVPRFWGSWCSFVCLRWDRAAAVAARLKSAPTSWIVWDKATHGMGNLLGSYAPQHETIWFYAGSGFRFPNGRPADVIRWPRIDSGKIQHPCEKPVGLVSRLLSDVGGGVVCDPFMGSGTTLVAAKNLGRRAIGIEIEEKYCEIAVKRLAQTVLPL